MGKLFFAVFFICTAASSAVFTGVGKKPLVRAALAFSSFVLSILSCYGILKLIEVWSGILPSELLPDRFSKLCAVAVGILVSILVSLTASALTAGGLKHYLTVFAGKIDPRLIAAVALICIAALFAGAFRYSEDFSEKGLVISEVCAHNFTLAADSEGEYPDYIELYNSGKNEIGLSRYFLSDNAEDMELCPLPDVTIAPGEYVLLWADGKGTVTDKGEIHLNFKVGDKDYIFLYDSSESAAVSTVTMRNLDYNVSMQYRGGEWINAYGTPGISNEGCEIYNQPTLDKPVFSLPSGFYSPGTELKIEVPLGCRIYYTLHGEDPGTDSIPYDGPIILNDPSAEEDRYVNVKNTVTRYDDANIPEGSCEKVRVIRAIAADSFGHISKPATATYIVGNPAEKYREYAVLSIVTDPGNLFGDDGICVTGKEYDDWYQISDRSEKPPEPNFTKKGRLWERPSTVQYWNESGELILDQDCGIRIQGNSTRYNRIKRFSLFARKIYSGSYTFDSTIFSSGVPTHSFSTREDPYDFAVQQLIRDRYVQTVDGIPCVIFIDGELYDISFLREKYDEQYFKEYCGVDGDYNLVSEKKAESGKKSDQDEFTEFVKFTTENDFSDDSVYEKACDMIDMQSFIDFMAINIYSGNLDMSIARNCNLWRSQASGTGFNDGKWRFLAFDMDGIFWSGDRVGLRPFEVNGFDYALSADRNNPYITVPAFNNLLKNDEFRNRFFITYLDLMNVNFSEKTALPILKKYGFDKDSFWQEFLTLRREKAVSNLKNAFDLNVGECEVWLSAKGKGKIKINTSTADTSDGSWCGTYLEGMDISLSAIPEEGYVFAGWSGDSSSKDGSITVKLENDIGISAIFEKKGGDDNG